MTKFKPRHIATGAVVGLLIAGAAFAVAGPRFHDCDGSRGTESFPNDPWREASTQCSGFRGYLPARFDAGVLWRVFEKRNPM